MLKGELVFSVLIVIISAVLYWVSRSFEGMAVYARLGPAVWPKGVLTLLMILGVLVSITTARRISRENAWGEKMLTLDPNKRRFFTAIGLIVVYLILIKYMGFILSTPPFMILFMILLGEKSKGWMAGVSFGMTAIIVILFTKAMYVPLPRGIWLFREFSLLFY